MLHSGHSALHGVEFSRPWPCCLIMLSLKKLHAGRVMMCFSVCAPPYLRVVH